MRRISLKFISCNTSFRAKCSQQVIKNPYKRTKLQMFVPQAGKSVQSRHFNFNHSCFLCSFWCPRFETEVTENKHGAPGKENTDKFTPALSFCLGLSHVVPPTPPPSRTLAEMRAHTHTGHAQGRKSTLHNMCFRRFARSCTTNPFYVISHSFAFLHLVKHV